jgi:hypothetical protein
VSWRAVDVDVVVAAAVVAVAAAAETRQVADGGQGHEPETWF